MADVLLNSQVLIVDDEEDFSAMVKTMLEAKGCQACTVSSASKALEILQQRSFDVILSDLNMPEISGQMFYEQLRIQYPQYLSRLGFITGDTLGSSAQKFLSEDNKRYLEKPFTPTEIRSLVEEIISANQS